MSCITVASTHKNSNPYAPQLLFKRKERRALKGPRVFSIIFVLFNILLVFCDQHKMIRGSVLPLVNQKPLSLMDYLRGLHNHGCNPGSWTTSPRFSYLQYPLVHCPDRPLDRSKQCPEPYVTLATAQTMQQTLADIAILLPASSQALEFPEIEDMLLDISESAKGLHDAMEAVV